ncbi:hypothetical protein GCM10017673_38440 [Streptosporangium violaceochromogenes]|nr:hypothetical protein GCM10017673_38440 [Streptosporangium violaceochromogenes]
MTRRTLLHGLVLLLAAAGMTAFLLDLPTWVKVLLVPLVWTGAMILVNASTPTPLRTSTRKEPSVADRLASLRAAHPMWRTLSFSAAAPGWRLAYLDPQEPEGYFTVPLPGWVTQEECVHHPATGVTTRPPVPDTRVFPAAADEIGHLEEADLSSNFWLVLPPGAEPPTAEAAREESAARRQRGSESR